MTNTDKHSLAKQAFERMQQHGIVPTPENYAIWFRYIEGSNAELVREVDALLAGGLAFSEENTAYLHSKYIASKAQEKKIEDVATDTQKVLAEVQKLVAEFSGETTNYNKGIDKALTDISANLDEGNVKNIVRTLVETTKTLKASGEAMNQKLAESNREINNLKKNLQQVTAESQRDHLTGAYNRKTFEKYYDEYVEHANAKNSELCLLILDIDHFKKFNDTYGHLIGDEVLKIVARTLTDTLKGRDIVARFGGEEFVILLPDTPIDVGMRVADILRTTISSKELKRKDTGENFGTITVSMGVARYRHGGTDTLPTLLKRADDALYKSKHDGRNRVSRETP
jgi:diguanylate cyclase